MVSFKKGESRGLGEILRQLGVERAATENRGDWQPGHSTGPQAVAGGEDPLWPAGVESPGRLVKGGSGYESWRHDPQVHDAIAKVTLYLQVQRDLYYAVGQPIAEERRKE